MSDAHEAREDRQAERLAQARQTLVYVEHERDHAQATVAKMRAEIGALKAKHARAVDFSNHERDAALAQRDIAHTTLDEALEETTRLRPLAEIGAAIQRLEKWAIGSNGNIAILTVKWYDYCWRLDIYEGGEQYTFSEPTIPTAVDAALKGQENQNQVHGGITGAILAQAEKLRGDNHD